MLSVTRRLRLHKTPSQVRKEATAQIQRPAAASPAGALFPFLLRRISFQAFGFFRFSLFRADEESAHKSISDARRERVSGIQKFICLAPECTSLRRRLSENVAKIIVDLVKPFVRRSKKVPRLIDQQARLGNQRIIVRPIQFIAESL